jgi:integrase
LPATTDTVELFVTSRIGAAAPRSTIMRRIAGIRANHRAAGEAVPDTKGCWKLLHEYARDGKGGAGKKKAVGPDELRKMLRACGADPLGRRDRAMLVLGFTSSLRRSELAALDLADVRFVAKGVELTVGRSKTDQEGKGRVIGLQPSSVAYTCPVRTLQRWIAERGRKPGPLFRRMTRHGADLVLLDERINGRVVADVVQRAAAAAGLKGDYAAHSLRAGFVSTALANGANPLQVMERTGHRSVQMLAEYYRPGSPFASNPLASVL